MDAPVFLLLVKEGHTNCIQQDAGENHVVKSCMVAELDCRVAQFVFRVKSANQGVGYQFYGAWDSLGSVFALEDVEVVIIFYEELVCGEFGATYCLGVLRRI